MTDSVGGLDTFIEIKLKNRGLCRDKYGKLHSIYSIPAATEFDVLDLSGMIFEKLPDLTKIKVNDKINLRACKNLISLKGLPEGVKILDCHDCQSLMSFEGLPKSIEQLDCSDCISLKSFKGLLEGVKAINCRSCFNLSSFEGLPNSVEELDCSACRRLAMYSLGGGSVGDIKIFPVNVKTVKCCYCDCLKTLENIPPTIEMIDITCCYQIKYIPDYIPNEKINGLTNNAIRACKQNWLNKLLENNGLDALSIADINYIKCMGREDR